MRISLGPDVLQDFEQSTRREWLVTNGLGGYASSSLSGANTRHYHGLLVAATEPPCVRRVLLSQLEAVITCAGQTFELGANQYPGAIHPQGYLFLTKFEPWPAPTFRFELPNGAVIEKRVWMAYRRNTVYVRYALVTGPKGIDIRLSPLVCDKSYHSEMSSGRQPGSVDLRESEARVRFFDDGPTLCLSVAESHVEPADYWHYRQLHEREHERGWESEEDLYCPCHFEAALTPGSSVTLIATTEQETAEPDSEWKAHLAREAELLRRGNHRTEFEAQLLLAADAFVIEGGSLAPPSQAQPERSTVIAGYHWFTDWGRDTMISLPGLCLATGRTKIARDILSSFARHVHQGLIPNRFPDRGAEPEFNTIDASLWFIQAGWAYLAAVPDDHGLLAELWPAWTQIFQHHLAGTLYGIRVDPEDGLMEGGAPGIQLTWMDAKAGDWVVTPRAGKPVEVNALWYNALRILETLAPRVGDDPANYRAAAAKAMRSFRLKYPRPDGKGLFDVLGPDGLDASVRPNQIFAVSLPFSPLTGNQQRSVVNTVETELLTPVGLRSLSPGDPCYRPRYEGGPLERDGAYHQGTVWTWLLGPFVEAHLRVYRDKARARQLLDELASHLTDAGIGYLCEIYDGDPPHRPNGCIAQAWSVAETLRVTKLLDA